MGQEILSPRNSSPSGDGWEAPISASIAILELTATEHPELLEFQIHVLGNSTMSFALEKLATAFDVSRRRIGSTVLKACKDLDRLEQRRGAWREPAKILDSPNLAALLSVGTARLGRLSRARRLRLERIMHKVERAYRLARSRAWIEAFIGPLPKKSPPAQTADV